MPTKEKKTKAQIAAAAAAGARNKKKKWAHDRKAEKQKNSAFFSEEGYARFLAEVPKLRVITPYVVSEKYKINLSLARCAIRELEEQQLIKRATDSQKTMIYTVA